MLYEVTMVLYADAFCREVDLKFNTQLLVIKFHVLSLISFNPVHGHSRRTHVPLLLAQIASDYIHEIDIKAAITTPADLDQLDWTTIANILERPNYSSLQKLTISSVPGKILDDVKKWMEERLPNGRARDAIECTQ